MGRYSGLISGNHDEDTLWPRDQNDIINYAIEWARVKTFGTALTCGGFTVRKSTGDLVQHLAN